MPDTQTKFDVYKKLAKLDRATEFNEYWMEAFQREIGGNSPLNIAILLEEDLDTVQSLFESDPNYFNGETLGLACQFGAKEGVIQYLAAKKPELITADNLVDLASDGEYWNAGEISAMARLKPEAVSTCYKDEPGVYPIGIAMQERVAESDVRTLVELWPECVIAPIVGGRQRTPLQKCLQKGYSSELLEFMIEKIPETIDNFVLSSEGDRPTKTRDLVWIKHVFQRCHGKFDSGRNFRWEGPGFNDFLSICFLQHQNIKELQITLPVPSKVDTSDERIDLAELTMKEFKQTYSLLEHQKHSQISKLTTRFSHHAYCELLGFLPHCPHLSDLTVDVADHLDQSMPALCHLLQQEKLERFTLYATSAAIASKKRKRPSQEVNVPLKPLFNALATNDTLTYLSIDPLGAEGVEELHCDLLLNVLKQNTTLEDVYGFFSEPRWSSTQLLIDHYLKFNRCGRKMAQDDSATLQDFVGLLESAQSKLNFYDGYGSSMRFPDKPYWRPNDWLSTLYGLLRAGINKWS